MNKQTIELEDGWSQMQEKGINRLINFLENLDQTSFDKRQYSILYTTIYNMCTQQRNKNFSKPLYDRYGETLERYISDYLVPKLSIQSSALEFLTCGRNSWKKYVTMTKWLRNFFQYLDRHHVTQNNLASLQEVSYQKFQIKVIQPMKDQLITTFLEILKKDRENEDLDREILKEIYSMLYLLDKSKTEFQKLCPIIEEQVLRQTYEYYAEVSIKWLTEDSLPDYLIKAEDHLKQDKNRMKYIMGEESATKIEMKYLEIVIKEKISQLLEKDTGMNYLLAHNLRRDLFRLHILTASLNECKSCISSILNKYIKSEGEVIINEKIQKNQSGKKDSPEDPEFVKALMDLLKRFKSLLDESFKNDSSYQRSINLGFEDIVNKRIGKHTFAEILACFSDKLLKKSNNKMNEEEIEAKLVDIIEIFEHLEDKQLFAEIFKNQLAKRLLNDLSANADAERSIISKMKMCCGSNFTAKMEGMNNDLKLAEELQEKYRAFQRNRSEVPIEFSVQVLTNSHWPVFKNNSVKLPEEMQFCIERFKEFYSFYYPRKKLYWMVSLGTVELTKIFDSGKYDFVCSPTQGLTLMLFNESPIISFKEIKNLMSFDDDFCKKVLNVFINPKHKILEKFPDDKKKANEEDNYRVNPSFASQVKRIKLPVPSQDENFEKEKVAEDRNHAIDATIVRIMKLRKQIGHNNLISEVINVLQVFRPQIRDIKQRIENLISREFLERDKADHNQYNYLA